MFVRSYFASVRPYFDGVRAYFGFIRRYFDCVGAYFDGVRADFDRAGRYFGFVRACGGAMGLTQCLLGLTLAAIARVWLITLTLAIVFGRNKNREKGAK